VQEILLFALLLGALLALGLVSAVPGIVLIQDGQYVMLAAAAVGLPLQALYYALLGAALSWSGVRPRGWYWRPFAHHHLLSPRQRWLVLPVFWIGALAFLVILLAIATVLLGLVDMALEG
jgi:hypothetical protein